MRYIINYSGGFNHLDDNINRNITNYLGGSLNLHDNKIVKLFTMVKDEDDIVEDWLIYHGKLFGYNNLYIIDNYSSDDTYRILQKYEKEKGINLSREMDYKKKGEYMTNLINSAGSYDIAYPIDIDEFITYYNKDDNTISSDKVNSYLNSLQLNNEVFKTQYVNSLIDESHPNGYERATRECKFGQYVKYDSHGKTFLNKKLWKGQLDHGNHYPTNNYKMSDLVLIHYHKRNYEQLGKKTLNNVVGLGYDPNNLKQLKQLVESGCDGYHHILRRIDILNGNFLKESLVDENIKSRENLIDLSPFINFLDKI